MNMPGDGFTEEEQRALIDASLAIGGYFPDDLYDVVRGIVAARLAAVEALADEWEGWASDYQPPLLPRNAARALRAALAADPSEATTRDEYPAARARLAAVEALADQWEEDQTPDELGMLTRSLAHELRAAVRAAPSEATRD